MTRVFIIVEGATEESFVKGPLAEALWSHNVLSIPIIVGIPGHKGGRTSYARVQKDLLRQLRQDRTAYCSTMIDFYGMGQGFPGIRGQRSSSMLQVESIERAIKEDICSLIPHLRPDIRLIPYLSVHEYEALLFSDPLMFAQSLRNSSLARRFQEIRDGFATPEHINDNPETAPSKRVLALYPAYRKVIDGTLAANAIGIETMRRECTHFCKWLKRLESLTELNV